MINNRKVVVVIRNMRMVQYSELRKNRDLGATVIIYTVRTVDPVPMLRSGEDSMEVQDNYLIPPRVNMDVSKRRHLRVYATQRKKYKSPINFGDKQHNLGRFDHQN
jgi:hypothetical protein